jgi:hypothetical protein
MKKWKILAIGMVATGVIGFVLAIATYGSVRDDIAKTYRFTGNEPAPGGKGKPTKTYASDQSVGATTKAIVEQHEPADRRLTEAGAFLRYREDVVSIVPPARGTRGSRVLVDDEEGGYHRNYGYVGGFWGTYSGPAGSFRGGGPGTGK